MAVFTAVYMFCLFLSMFIAISLPIDRAMPYYRVIGCLFSIIILTALAGICVFLAETGFYPPEKELDPEDNEWHETGEYYFSWLTLAGVIMLSVYLLPFLMRPVDFI